MRKVVINSNQLIRCENINFRSQFLLNLKIDLRFFREYRRICMNQGVNTVKKTVD